MKIREGFVSNSSSSSFVLKWDKSKFTKCECCRQTPKDPIALIEQEEQSRWNEESSIDWISTESWREVIQDYMLYPLEELQRLREMDLDSVAYDFGITTVESAIKSNQDDLAKHQSKIEVTYKLDKEEPDKTICGVSIDYHSYINNILKELISSDLVQVIESN